jgi:nitrite reductase/ring-hydroxylating ferredoxin subunit
MLRARLCKLEEVVEGELRAFSIAGLTWPVIATVLEGEIVATAGVCPHEDVALDDGELCEGRVVCPGHGYAFDLRSGRCQHDGALMLRCYRVTVAAGEVWIDLV